MYRLLGRICYGLSAASIVFSLGAQFKMLQGISKKPQGWFQGSQKTNAQSERQGIFFGLWAPTLAIAGKILDDMGNKSLSTGVKPMSSDEHRDGNTSANAGKTQEPWVSTH